jgi:hypothetical protein
MTTDYKEQAYREYLELIHESGVPLWVLDYYALDFAQERARPLCEYQITWADEFGSAHVQIAQGYNIHEAIAYIENQARVFGYKECRFIKAEACESDDHPLVQDTWHDDLPF